MSKRPKSTPRVCVKAFSSPSHLNEVGREFLVGIGLGILSPTVPVEAVRSAKEYTEQSQSELCLKKKGVVW